MNLVGAVDRRAAGGEIGRGCEEDIFAVVRHAGQREPGPREELHHALVALEPREHLRVPDPAPRVLVGGVDQLADRVHTITLHVCRHTLGHGDDFPSDHEHAVIAALRELLTIGRSESGFHAPGPRAPQPRRRARRIDRGSDQRQG